MRIFSEDLLSFHSSVLFAGTLEKSDFVPLWDRTSEDQASCNSFLTKTFELFGMHYGDVVLEKSVGNFLLDFKRKGFPSQVFRRESSKLTLGSTSQSFNFVHWKNITPWRFWIAPEFNFERIGDFVVRRYVDFVNNWSTMGRQGLTIY